MVMSHRKLPEIPHLVLQLIRRVGFHESLNMIQVFVNEDYKCGKRGQVFF
jgi:hypothetical protein